MTEMQVINLLGLGIAIVAGGLYFLPVGTCKHCPHCREEERQKRLAAEQRSHDAEHKGFGYTDTSPDRYACRDESCRRNPKP